MIRIWYKTIEAARSAFPIGIVHIPGPNGICAVLRISMIPSIEWNPTHCADQQIAKLRYRHAVVHQRGISLENVTKIVVAKVRRGCHRWALSGWQGNGRRFDR